MKLGDVLKKESEKRGLSTRAMAEVLGVTESEYLAIEAGKKPRVDSKKLIEWGERFGLNILELDEYLD